MVELSGTFSNTQVHVHSTCLGGWSVANRSSIKGCLANAQMQSQPTVHPTAYLCTLIFHRQIPVAVESARTLLVYHPWRGILKWLGGADSDLSHLRLFCG